MIALTRDITLRVAILTAILCSAMAAVYILADVEPSPLAALVVNFGTPIPVILWLQKDAHRTGVGAVRDFGLFVWVAWPVVIPWYVLKSRGRAGWRLLLGLLALMTAPYTTSVLVWWLMWGATG